VTFIWTFFLLMALSFLPPAAFFIWLRKKKPELLNTFSFLLFLAGGMLALVIALFLQTLFPAQNGLGKGTLLFKTFVQTALTEEAGRAVVLGALFGMMRRQFRQKAANFAAAGIALGLGFAAVETAYFSLANMNIALLRALTAAPLHAACSAHLALALCCLEKKKPRKAWPRFIYAAALHGLYDVMVVQNGLLSVVSLLLALTSFASVFQKAFWETPVFTGSEPDPDTNCGCSPVRPEPNAGYNGKANLGDDFQKHVDSPEV
jgi:RsiW-degrading membrane proteinase PrsW (M82 family)